MNESITVADLGQFPELSVPVAQICVWGVRENRITQSRRALLELGADYTEGVVRDIAKFFSILWGVDDSVETRKSCAVCGRHRHAGEDLCPCFANAGLGRYLRDVQSLEDIGRYAALEPKSYRDFVFERARCLSCGAVFSTTLGRVEKKLRAAQQHNSHLSPDRLGDAYCRACDVRWRDEKRAADARFARREPPSAHQPVQPMRQPAPALAAVGAKLAGHVPAAPPPAAAPSAPNPGPSGAEFGAMGAPPALPHNAGAHAAPAPAPAPARKGKGKGKAAKGRAPRASLAELSEAVASESGVTPEA